MNVSAKLHLASATWCQTLRQLPHFLLGREELQGLFDMLEVWPQHITAHTTVKPLLAAARAHLLVVGQAW